MIIRHRQELKNASRDIMLPFTLELQTDKVLIKKILRFAPGKRITAIGEYQEKDIIVKVFFDRKNAKIDYEQDAQGVKTLMKNNIPTATLFYDGPTKIPGVYVMILEYLKDAIILRDFWNNLPEDTKPTTFLYLVSFIAELHEKGVLQQDIHFHNFLVDKKNFFPSLKFYVIDGNKISQYPSALNLKQSMNNLAGFVAQIALRNIPSATEVITHYVQCRQYPLTTSILTEFNEKFSSIRQQRDKLCLDKIWRECSEFSLKKEEGFTKIWKREKSGDGLLFFLQQSGNYPPSHKEYLRQNPYETAIKCIVDEEPLVVKEFQRIPTMQQFKKRFPHSRGAKAWENAHRLLHCEINTPKPRAFMENSRGLFKGNSYYLYEFLPGKTFLDFFKEIENNALCSDYITKFVKLLKDFHELSLAYNTFSASDILIFQEEFYFLNVENISEYKRSSQLKTSQQKALTQFLQSIEEMTYLKSSLEKAFIEEQLL